MKSSREILKSELFQLVKMDYGFEIYNLSESVIRFSFYHLGSVYNAFCTSVFFDGKWSDPAINWQYASENKNAAKHAKKIVSCLVNLHRLKADKIAETEVNYYKALSDKVFSAKYSLDVELHTING